MRFAGVVLAVILCSSAGAAVRVDQDNRNLEGTLLGPFPDEPLETGFAQTFRAGRSGTLNRITAAVECDSSFSGTVKARVWHQDVAGTWLMLGDTLRDSSEFVGSDAVGLPHYHRFYFSGVPMQTGRNYMVDFAWEGTSCRFGFSFSMNYPRGDFGATGGTGGFTALASPDFDLAFVTFVDDGEPNSLCSFDAWNPSTDRVPSWAPLCHCLKHSDARSLLCRFDMPELVLFREIPFFEEEGEIRYSATPMIELGWLAIKESPAIEGQFSAPSIEAEGFQPGESRDFSTSFQRLEPGRITVEVGFEEGAYQFSIREDHLK